MEKFEWTLRARKQSSCYRQTLSYSRVRHVRREYAKKDRQIRKLGSIKDDQDVGDV